MMRKKLEQLWKRREKVDGGREEERKNKRGGKRRGEFFEISAKDGLVKRKKKPPPQCLIWFRLNGLGSSQNGQNSLIHNWCIGGCWFTQAMKRHLVVPTLWQVS